MMTREELLNRLASLPAELEAAEVEFVYATARLEEARNALAERRAALLVDPEAIAGRNEQQREAQLFDLTRQERRAVSLADGVREAARLRLSRLQHEFAAARSCARLLAGGEHES
jgi:hypothetical protein